MQRRERDKCIIMSSSGNSNNQENNKTSYEQHNKLFKRSLQEIQDIKHNHQMFMELADIHPQTAYIACLEHVYLYEAGLRKYGLDDAYFKAAKKIVKNNVDNRARKIIKEFEEEYEGLK